VGVVHIRHGKRGRARDVMLSPRLLAELRSYYRWARPQGPELFPGRIGAGSTLTRAAVEKAVKKAREQAGLGGRRVTPHTLRHYAGLVIMPSGRKLAEVYGWRSDARTGQPCALGIIRAPSGMREGDRWAGTEHPLGASQVQF
jgi:integrase